MSSRKRFSRGNKQYRKSEPVTTKLTLPADDTVVLQHDPLPPLERGGVYTEMGADITFEERNANMNEHLTSYSNIGSVVKSQYAGILALIVSIVALFVWPFWTGLSALILSFMSYSQGTKTLAWVSGTIAVIAMALSVISYFSQI